MKKAIIITGTVPGYPNKQSSLAIAKQLKKSGADILELSASFSEPIADGPTLQLAHQKVLASKFSKTDAFSLYEKIKKTTQAPLYVIEYANIIYTYGIDAYYKKMAGIGVNYITIPDVPLEESAPFVDAARKHGIAHIFLVAPTTPNSRIKKMVKITQETTPEWNVQNSSRIPSTFLYLISVTGITGSRKKLNPETRAFIKRVRSLTRQKLIVGFGISTGEHVQQVLDEGADGIVTCSAIVDIIHKYQNTPKQMLSQIDRFVKSLM